MSDVIDWSKAQEGYPIWIQGVSGGFVSGWYRELSDRYESPRGTYYMKRDAKYFTARTRPQQTPWSGEGLPPVGAVCEYRWNGGNWKQVTVFAIKTLASGGQCALFDIGIKDWSWSNNPEMFRPIRTPEQIAADEREADIDKLTVLLDSDRGRAMRLIAEAIYDAGYRKQ
jgi:hypothetical protein